MKNLRRIGLSFTLVTVLFTVVFAGETPSPPYAPGETETPPCAPGDILTPPCASQSVNDVPAVPGQTEGPRAAPAVTVSDIAETVFWALSLF